MDCHVLAPIVQACGWACACLCVCVARVFVDEATAPLFFVWEQTRMPRASVEPAGICWAVAVRQVKDNIYPAMHLCSHLCVAAQERAEVGVGLYVFYFCVWVLSCAVQSRSRAAFLPCLLILIGSIWKKKKKKWKTDLTAVNIDSSFKNKSINERVVKQVTTARDKKTPWKEIVPNNGLIASNICSGACHADGLNKSFISLSAVLQCHITPS